MKATRMSLFAFVLVLHFATGCRAPGALADVNLEIGQDGESDEFEEFEEFAEDAQTEHVSDPLIWYNRAMHHFNDKLYLWVWRHVVKGWDLLLPDVAQVAINDAYENLKSPVRIINCALQLKWRRSGEELSRFLINSTLGAGGLYDAADGMFELQAPPAEDFGQTLAEYGVGEGCPLELPFLGPSNLRDGFGLIPDAFLSPSVYYVKPIESVAITTGEYFNYSSLHLGEYESLKENALDPYTFFRDAYQQFRDKEIEE